MSLVQMALTLLLVVDAERSADGMSTLPVLAAVAAVDLSVMLILWFVIGRSREDGDDPGSGGGGPGWRRRRRPRRPPPHGPVCWPEFERQFAEHVAAISRRERADVR